MRPLLQDKAVEAFIRRFQKSVPVDVVALANVLGIEVYESKELPEGIAGKIIRDREHGGKSEYSIIVRGQDSFVRRRFTVAHEISHYLLHRHLFAAGGGLTDDAMYRSELSDSREAQANALAADLLMPWHLLRPLINLPLEELAEKFQVSLRAMDIRVSTPMYASKSLV